MLDVTFGDGTGVTFLSRSDTGLPERPRRGHEVPLGRFVGLVLHHTVNVVGDWDGDGVTLGDLDDIGRFMRNLAVVRAADLGPEVPYSFVVFRTPDPRRAVLAEGRGLGFTGAHTAGLNSTRYGIAYGGNTITDPVTPGVLSAIRWVGSWLEDPEGAAPTIGHRDTKATACPGTHLYAARGELQPPFIIPEDAMTPEQEAKLDEVLSRLKADEVPEAPPWWIGKRVQAIHERPADGINVDALADAIADKLAERLRS